VGNDRFAAAMSYNYPLWPVIAASLTHPLNPHRYKKRRNQTRFLLEVGQGRMEDTAHCTIIIILDVLFLLPLYLGRSIFVRIAQS
jgi:hypothetical protein